MKNRMWLAFIVAFLGGCVGVSEQDAESESVESATVGVAPDTVMVDVAPQDNPADVRVRARSMSVWVEPFAEKVSDDNGTAWVVRGRSSRNLSDVFSFVPDDAYGQARLLGPRSFELRLSQGSEVNTWMSGLPIFVRLTPQGQNSTTTYFASISVRPRLSEFSGNSAIYLEREVRPVFFRDDQNNLRYRAEARAPRSYRSLRMTNTGGTVENAVLSSPGNWLFSLPYQTLSEFTDNYDGAVSVQSATSVGKRTRLRVAVSSLGLTVLDPYEVWPSGQCQESVASCMRATPDGTVDFSHCGTYRSVQACSYQVWQ